MKIMSNRNIIKGMKKEAEKNLELYDMQIALLNRIEIESIKKNKSHIASRARAKANGIESTATWERGLIAGYQISLTLIK